MDDRWFVVRHPPVIGGNGVCYGSLDLEADPLAVDAVCSAVLADLPSMPIVSSPRRRCTVVATRLADRFGRGFDIDDRLCEMDFGEWEGRPWDEIDRAALDQWAADPLHFRPPGGESATMLLERVATFAADPPGEPQAPLLIVTHGGVLRALRALHARDPAAMLATPPAPGSLTRLSGDVYAAPLGQR